MLKGQARNQVGGVLGALVLILAFALAAAVGSAFFFGSSRTVDALASHIKFLEREDPEIEILEAAHGLGAAPASFRFEITDSGMGLDEVVVRVIQKNVAKEIQRIALKGEHSLSLPITLHQEKGGFDEGQAELEIKAFDKSFWSNAAEERLPLRIDYKKPRVEVVSAQHNAVDGGSQLLFYSAYDDHLAESGASVGLRKFRGFPAKGLDPALSQANLFAVFYAIPRYSNLRDAQIRAFAEDDVGNESSTGNFYFKNSPRSYRQVSIKLSEGFLRGWSNRVFAENLEKLKALPSLAHRLEKLSSTPHNAEKMLEQFDIINSALRESNEVEITSLLKGGRPMKLWDDVFLPQAGSISGSFGDKLYFVFGDSKIVGGSRAGYEFTMQDSTRGVIAANNGVVVFAKNLGVYGTAIGLDHGMGVSTVYGLVSKLLVKPGDSVRRGQQIALASTLEDGRPSRMIFEVRVGGVPVDAREWWDAPWTQAHIANKTNEVKRALGVPVDSQIPRPAL